MYLAPRCDINLQALQHNVMRVRQLAPTQQIIAMIKADAYGHGLLQVATSLGDVDALGVARVEEGIMLRDHGCMTPIVLMGGVSTEQELQAACVHRLDLVIHHWHQVRLLQGFTAEHGIFQVWLKVDTGMRRLGFAPEDVTDAYSALAACVPVRPTIGVMSHLAEADDLDSLRTEKQRKAFQQCLKNLPATASLANSATIISHPTMHYDVIRPGIMLYGVSPHSEFSGQHFGLLPVMTFYSYLIAIKACKRGDAIGYGGSWICPEDMLIGIVAVGYGDGYPRHIKTGTPVILNDKMLPVIGNVSMDMLFVDLRCHLAAQIGDKVILWGQALPVEVIAAHADTIPYTLLTGITPRVSRDYRHSTQ